MTVHIMTANGWRPIYKECVNSNDLQGVYRNIPIEVVRPQLDARSDRFLRANAIGSMLEKQHYFRGHEFPEPLYGAFGERL